MPFYYDVSGAHTSNGTANTTSTHLWAKTAANQETVDIKGIYVTGRGSTAGGAQLRAMSNTGTTASGGTGQTPAARNLRGNPAAQSVWANDSVAISAGGTLLQRLSIGFAQTGGMGGWVALEPSAGLQMQPNAANPVDMEFVSDAASASVPFDLTVEFSEGV